MSLSNGEVTINDLPTKSKLFRFCEKKIDQWIQSHAEGADTVEFKVSFTEEDEVRQVSCVTEIHLGGGAVWRGCDLAADTQQAFMHSLKRLQPH